MSIPTIIDPINILYQTPHINHTPMILFYRKKKKSKDNEKISEKFNKVLEEERKKAMEYTIPPTKAELAFMKQQEKLVNI